MKKPKMKFQRIKKIKKMVNREELIFEKYKYI